MISLEVYDAVIDDRVRDALEISEWFVMSSRECIGNVYSKRADSLFLLTSRPLLRLHSLASRPQRPFKLSFAMFNTIAAAIGFTVLTAMTVPVAAESHTVNVSRKFICFCRGASSPRF